MTKKSFLTLISLVFLVFMLAGCGDKKENDTTDTGDTGTVSDSEPADTGDAEIVPDEEPAEVEDTEIVPDTDPADTGDSEIVPDAADLNDLLYQKYPEEFAAYSYDSLPKNIVEQLFGVKIDDDGAGNDKYNYKDDNIILRKRGQNFQVVMNRLWSEANADPENMIKKHFKEAKYMAETLTSMKLEYLGTTRDLREASGEDVESSTTVNAVIFVFWPVIDGIIIFGANTEIEYDGFGFYQLRSNVPYSVSEIRRSAVKPEKQVDEEIYSALGKEEEKIIAYVLNEDDEIALSAVAKDDANLTYLTISLETNPN